MYGCGNISSAVSYNYIHHGSIPLLTYCFLVSSKTFPVPDVLCINAGHVLQCRRIVRVSRKSMSYNDCIYTAVCRSASDVKYK